MRALALMVVMVALIPIANAEQGDAEDRALTEQMMAHEKQSTVTESNADYGGIGKTTQSGHSVPNKKSEIGTETKNSQ